MIPTPTLIRQVAANGGISISVNGIAAADIAARIGAQAHELERAALELASTIEPRRYGR